METTNKDFSATIADPKKEKESQEQGKGLTSKKLSKDEGEGNFSDDQRQKLCPSWYEEQE